MIDENLVYNKEYFEENIDKLTCELCSSILSHPLVCKCGNALCKKCLYDYGKDTCPFCFKELVFTKNSLVHNSLKDLQLFCPNKCDTILYYDNFEEHVKNCSVDGSKCYSPNLFKIILEMLTGKHQNTRENDDIEYDENGEVAFRKIKTNSIIKQWQWDRNNNHASAITNPIDSIKIKYDKVVVKSKTDITIHSSNGDTLLRQHIWESREPETVVKKDFVLCLIEPKIISIIFLNSLRKRNLDLRNFEVWAIYDHIDNDKLLVQNANFKDKLQVISLMDFKVRYQSIELHKGKINNVIFNKKTDANNGYQDYDSNEYYVSSDKGLYILDGSFNVINEFDFYDASKIIGISQDQGYYVMQTDTEVQVYNIENHIKICTINTSSKYVYLYEDLMFIITNDTKYGESDIKMYRVNKSQNQVDLINSVKIEKIISSIHVNRDIMYVGDKSGNVILRYIY